MPTTDRDWYGRDTSRLYCSHSSCRKHIRDNAWSKTEAYDKGWMMQKNGDNWCPDHLPEWVEEWRAKKRKKK